MRRLSLADFDNRGYLKNISNKHLTILLVYADYCGHCHRVMPVLQKLESEFPNVDFAMIQADADPFPHELPRLEKLLGYQIFGFPTIQTFYRGKPYGPPYSGGRDYVTMKRWLMS